MNIKLFFKKLFYPYKFKYLKPSDYYLDIFYDDLINLDGKICIEQNKEFVNYVLFYDEYPNIDIFMFKDCLESMGFSVTYKFYIPDKDDIGVIFTIDLKNLWQLV